MPKYDQARLMCKRAFTYVSEHTLNADLMSYAVNYSLRMAQLNCG